MKHTYTKRTPILTLFTLFALAMGSQFTFGQNLITNGTFDHNINDWTFWQNQDDNDDSFEYNTDGYNVSGSGKLTRVNADGLNNSSPYIAQDVNLVSGETYNISLWHKGDLGRLALRMVKDTYNSGNLNTLTNSDSNWQEITATYTPTETGLFSFRIFNFKGTDNTTSYSIIDDVTITKLGCSDYSIGEATYNYTSGTFDSSTNTYEYTASLEITNNSGAAIDFTTSAGTFNDTASNTISIAANTTQTVTVKLDQNNSSDFTITPTSCSAITFTPPSYNFFKNDSNISWGTDASWSKDAKPVTTDDVVVLYELGAWNNITVNSLEVENGAAFNIWSGNNFTVTTNTTIEQGTLNNRGNYTTKNMIIKSTGTYNANINTLTSSLTTSEYLIIENSGTISQNTTSSISCGTLTNGSTLTPSALTISKSLNNSGSFSCEENLSLYGNINNTGSLTVTSSASLESASLSNSGSLGLESDSSNFSILKTNTVTNTGTITYKYYTPKSTGTGSGETHFVTANIGLITPPLNGEVFGDFVDNSENNDLLNKWKYYGQGNSSHEKLFGEYKDGAYVNYISNGTDDETVLKSGKGYRASLFSGNTYTGSNSNSDNYLVFTGDILTGNQTATVGSNSDGWDLIGNPYTTGLSLNQFVTDNNSKLHANATGITYWDNDTSAFVTKIAEELGTTDIVIPPGQAFFIAPAANITSVDFNTSQQETQTGGGFNRSSNTLKGFNLILSNTTASKSTKVYLNNTTTLGVDKGHEAAAIGLSVNGFGLYTVMADNSVANTPFAIQTIPATDLENTTLKLGVNAGLGEHTISLEGINLPENLNVYLTDLANGSQTLLNKYDYTFNVTDNKLESTERFLISFQSDALSTGNNILEDLQITAFQNTITVNGDLKNNTTLKVYDLQGRKVAQIALSNNNRQLTVNNSAGIYVVNLSNAQGSKTQKVILK